VPSRARALLLAVLIGGGVIWVLSSNSRPPAPISPGRLAPDFSLPTLSGSGDVSLASLRGHVVLINFWATWCKPCENEMPAMQRLYEALAPQGLELLAVSVDSGRKEVVAFKKRLGLGFPILLDPGKRAAARYQSDRFPESFLIDRRGILVERYIGSRAWDAPAYIHRIQRLLSAADHPEEAAPPG